MMFLPSVAARMPIGRGITAERDPARLARSQMYPGTTNRHTGFALPPPRDLDLTDGGDVRAGLCHNQQATMTNQHWPALPYSRWKPTYETLHMWLQVAGKVAVATGPRLNHCWGSAMHVTTTGLSTTNLSHAGRTFSLAFDFIDHQFRVETLDGDRRSIPLVSQSVAAFYRQVMDTLKEMGLPIHIWSMPVEIPSPIRFEQDTAHATYDPAEAQTFWRILAQVERVLTASRTRFIGKASPANFFWGSCDLALTRFSGRPAPAREGPAFMRDAYSHEVISHGFWPGNALMPEAVFYAYAVPEPEGLKTARPQPPAATYDQGMGEFILPYDAVRTAPSPEAALAAFIDSTYERAATLAAWDRPALER
jgi:hypothetical protein